MSVISKSETGLPVASVVKVTIVELGVTYWVFGSYILVFKPFTVTTTSRPDNPSNTVSTFSFLFPKGDCLDPFESSPIVCKK